MLQLGRDSIDRQTDTRTDKKCLAKKNIALVCVHLYVCMCVVKGGGALPRLSETDFVQGVFGTLN